MAHEVQYQRSQRLLECSCGWSSMVNTDEIAELAEQRHLHPDRPREDRRFK